MGKRQSSKAVIEKISLNLFSKYGFTGTSIRMIAKNAGVRESAIYNHFNSKADLLNKIFDKFNSGEIGGQILDDKLLEEIVNPPVFMKKFFNKLFEIWNSEIETMIFKIIILEQFSNKNEIIPTIDKYFQPVREIWEMIFIEMIKHNVIKKLDPKLLVDEFLSYIFLLRIKSLTEQDNDNKKIIRKINSHIDFFWDKIKT